MIISNSANTFAAMQYIAHFFIFIYKVLRLGIEYALLLVSTREGGKRDEKEHGK